MAEKSPPSTKETTIVFDVRIKEVKLFWHDFWGDLVSYGKVGLGLQARRTLVGHLWTVAESSAARWGPYEARLPSGPPNIIPPTMAPPPPPAPMKP